MAARAGNLEFKRVRESLGANAFAEQILRAFGFHLLKHGADACDGGVGDCGIGKRALVDVADVRNRRAKGAKNRAERKHADMVETGLLCDAAGEETAIAAISKENMLRKVLLQLGLRRGDHARDR